MKKYVLDKRVIKKNLKKYGAIFSVLFVLFIVISYVMNVTGANSTTRIVFLVVFGLFFVAGVEWVLYVKNKEKQQGKTKKVKTIKCQTVVFNDDVKNNKNKDN